MQFNTLIFSASWWFIILRNPIKMVTSPSDHFIWLSFHVTIPLVPLVSMEIRLTSLSCWILLGGWIGLSFNTWSSWTLAACYYQWMYPLSRWRREHASSCHPLPVYHQSLELSIRAFWNVTDIMSSHVFFIVGVDSLLFNLRIKLCGDYCFLQCFGQSKGPPAILTLSPLYSAPYNPRTIE